MKHQRGLIIRKELFSIYTNTENDKWFIFYIFSSDVQFSNKSFIHSNMQNRYKIN